MPANGTDPTPPVGVDPTRASVARVYDALLGGKDNYEVDRKVVDQLRSAMPEVADGAIENRAFLIRVCRFLARETGVTQYLDLGSGLPTAENVHQVVQRLNRDAKVVYVDNDPVVAAHGRALLEQNESTHFIEADIWQPDTVLQHEVVRTHLDLTQPVALLMLSVLHNHKGDRHRPAEIVHAYADALAPGSYLAISHLFDPESEDTDERRVLDEALRSGSLQGATFRTHAEVTEFFTGLDIVHPGLVRVVDWWPDGPRFNPLNTAQQLYVGGVGRKPAQP